jgi:YD repeat-containing protein
MSLKLCSAIVGLLLTSILSGCGGSSSSSQQATNGVYKDAGIVSGLQYKTATQSGVTDKDGTFRYVAGETVTFSVSNVTIGQAAGAPIVTTFDLVGIAPPTSSFGIQTNNPTSKKFQEAINISLFLQTLDDDSDPTNGIAIPAVVNTVVAVTPINFKFTSSIFGSELGGVFRDSAQFKVFIGSCRTAGAWGGTKAIKQLGYAANSLYQGLGIVPSVYLQSQTAYSDSNFYNVEYTNSGLVSKFTDFYNSESPSYIRTKNYDKNGNIVSDVNMDPRTSETGSTTNYFYDANGNLVRITEKNQYFDTESAIEYDINGNRTSQISRFNGNVQTRTNYTYNANGTLATEKRYNSSDELEDTYVYTYNSNLLLVNYKYIGNYSSSDITVEYDNNNNVTNLIQVVGSYNSSTNFAYDNFGNLVSYYQYENNSLISKVLIGRNNAGYPVTTDEYDSNNQIVRSSVATYDENGSRVRVVIEYGGTTETTTSTFIKQSGWGDIINSIGNFFGPA